MFDFNFTTTGGGILTMAYTDFIRCPLYKRRAIKYQNLDISIDENGLPSICSNEEVVNPKDFDLNDNIEIYKNINLLKTLNDVEEELYRKFDDIEVKINRLENEVLLTFIEEAKQIDNELKRKILVDYITRKLTEE